MTIDTNPPCVYSDGLTAIRGIRHGFFTRDGGVSEAEYRSLNCSLGSGDQHQHIMVNRRRVADALGGTVLVTNQQVHGNRVRTLTTQSDFDLSEQADGMVTTNKSICLGALGADCAPVLFADGDATVVGVAHAGWQGALAGVTDAVIEAMVGLGAQPGNIYAAIGPAIQLSSYEVGEQFQRRFERESPVDPGGCFAVSEKTGNVHFDLPGYIGLRLQGHGLAGIDQLGHDTYLDEERFFSYRRACHRGEEKYGRQVGAICLT